MIEIGPTMLEAVKYVLVVVMGSVLIHYGAGLIGNAQTQKTQHTYREIVEERSNHVD